MFKGIVHPNIFYSLTLMSFQTCNKSFCIVMWRCLEKCPQCSFTCNVSEWWLSKMNKGTTH